MAYSEARKNWDKENTVIFSVKFFKTNEQDLIDFMDSKVDPAAKVGRGTVLKQALRFYMESEKAAQASSAAQPATEPAEVDEFGLPID